MADESRSGLLKHRSTFENDLENSGRPSLDTTDIEESGIDRASESVAYREEQSRWQKLRANRFTGPLGRFFTAIFAGPSHPRDDPPRPISGLKQMEVLPDRFRRWGSETTRQLALLAYLAVWVLIWSRVLLPYFTEIPQVGNDADAEVISLTCGDSSDFWRGKNAECGLDAHMCPHIDQNHDVIIRCPALCDRGSWLYSSRAVGDQLIKYRGYFIGGGRIDKKEKNGEEITHPYRADSFPCGAGVHAGIISPFFGGCARATFKSGPQTSFPAKKGKYGVSDSVEFSSFFPSSYTFKDLGTSVTHSKDPRLVVLIMNIVLGIPIVVFGSSAVFIWVIMSVGFWTICLATDPPTLVDPSSPETFYELISLSLERFLPTCFVMFFLWKVSIKRTFSKPETSSRIVANSEEDLPPTSLQPSGSPMSRLIFWYPFFWLGVLNNITFDRLPVDRLIWKDLQKQPGALVVVCVFAVIIVVCVITQAYSVWLSGRFNKLIKVYIMMFASLFAIAWIPGLTLRIHHYIFALMFIPGCSTRGRTAYVFQGILLGLFLSGVARWGYASIAETNMSLLRGEPAGKITPPQIFSVNATSGMLYWEDTLDVNVLSEAGKAAYAEELTKYTHVSLLVNDVERLIDENHGKLNLTQLVENNHYLNELVKFSMLQSKEDVDLYLRIARYDPTSKRHGDYTKAYILQYPSFNFTQAAPGVT